MALINSPSIEASFELGLIPGVFLGSMIAALLAREFKLEGFHGGHNMLRYIAGAILMGFGGMLAGGCSVGAAITGSAVFSLTAWTALFAMLGSGAIAHCLIDGSKDCALSHTYSKLHSAMASSSPVR